VADTDGDGLDDGEEVNETETDPLDPESDDSTSEDLNVEESTDALSAGVAKGVYSGGFGCSTATSPDRSGPAGWLALLAMVGGLFARRRSGDRSED
jgi:MYXO-CTERM domain-containing protein